MDSVDEATPEQDLSSLVFPEFEEQTEESQPTEVRPTRILPDDPRLLDALESQESSGNANAIGPMTRYGRAKGAYQFIDETWERYADPGDDVFNKEHSRKNASKYLKDLYKRYDEDINLTLAAYNTGEGNVDKAIEKAGSKSYGDIAPYLATETQNYVPGILGKYNKSSPALEKQVGKAKLPGEIDNRGFAQQLQPIVNTPEYQSLSSADQIGVLNKLYRQNIYAPEVKESLKKLSDNIWSAASPEEMAMISQAIGRPDRVELQNEKDPTKKLNEWKNNKIAELERQGIAPELLDKPLNDIFAVVSQDEKEAASIRNRGKVGQFVTHLGEEFRGIGKGLADIIAQPTAFGARAMSDTLGVSDYSTTISKLPDALLGEASRLGKYVVDEKGYIALDENGDPIEQWDTGLFRVVGNVLGTIAGGVGLKVLGAGDTAVAAAVSSTNVLTQANLTFQSVYSATGDKEKAYMSAFLSMPGAEIGALFQLSQISKFGTATTKGLSELNKFKYFAKEAAKNTVKGGGIAAIQSSLTQGAEIVSTGQEYSPERTFEEALIGGAISGLVGPAVKGIEQGRTLKREAMIKEAVTSQLQDFQYSHATEMSIPVEERFVDTDALSILGQTVAGKDESGNVRIVKTGAIAEESINPDESLANVVKYLTPSEVLHYNRERSDLLSKAREEQLSEADVNRLHDIDNKLVGTEDPAYFNRVKANEADFIQKEKEAGLPSRGVHWDADRGEFVNDNNPALSDPFLKAALGLETLEVPSTDPAAVSRPQPSHFPYAAPQKPLSNKFTPREFFSVSGEKPMSPRRVVEATKKIIKLAGGREATIKEGGRLRKGALGYYSPAAAVIRVRSLRDIPTFVHEVTHQVDHDLQDIVLRTAKADPTVGAAFIEQAQTFYPDPRVNKNTKLALREGITTFLQNYTTGDPVHADLLNWWNGKFKQDHPEIHAQYEEVKNLAREYYSQTLEARQQGFKSVDEPGVYQKFKDKFLNARAWYSLADKDFIFREADEITGRAGRFNPRSYRGFIEGLDRSSEAYVTGLVSGDVFSDRQGNVIPGQRTLKQTTIGLTPEQIGGLEDGLIAYNAKSMIARGQNPGLSKQEVQQAINRFESRPDIGLLRQRQREIYDWQTKVVDVLSADSPRMQEVIKRVRQSNKDITGEEHGYYVPFQRQGFEEGVQVGSKKEGGETTPTGILARKGSDRPIQNIFDSFEKQAQAIGLAGLKNQLYDKLVKDLKRGMGAGNLIERVPARMEKKFEAEYLDVLSEGVKALKKKTGVDTGPETFDFLAELSNVTGASFADILTTSLQFFGPETTFKSPTKGYTVISIPKASGKGHEFYEIHPDVLKAFNGIEQTGILANPVFDALVRTPKRFLQVGATTLNPVFQVKNFFGRDWQSALLLQEKGFHAGAFFKNLIGQIGEQIVTKATGRETGAAAYAARMGFNTATRAGAAKEIAYVAKGKGLGARVWKASQSGLETLEWFGSLGENTTRLAAMKAKADQLGLDLNDAKTKVNPIQAIDLALAYKNATVNFSKRGSGTGVTYLRESVPFFGARLAATTQSIEAAGASPKRALAFATTSFALGMYAYLNNAKKDWYDDLSAQTKASSFVIDADKNIIAIPMDSFNAVFHGLGVIAAQQFVQESDNEASTLQILREAINQTSPIDLPTERTGVLGLASAPAGPLAKSVLEQATNTKFWTGAPIVDERKAPTEQHTPRTSELIKQVGKELQMSPDRIEYFVSTYAAGPLKIEKYFEEQMGFRPPSKEAAENLFLQGFTRAASNAAIQDQSRTKFYGAVAEANQNKFQETEPQGDARKLINRVSKQITELNKSIGTEEDPEKLELLYLQRRDLFKEGAAAWRAVKGPPSEESE